jgi:energy-coupling factor transporter ATP-binding protein EcfA2
MVFQNPADQLFAATLAEDVAFGPTNMGLPPDEVDRRVADALDAVGLVGLGSKPVQRLSFGQQKRACIAGLIAMGQEIMLLDEPTAGLDPITAHTIMALLIKERDVSQATTLLATHRFQDGNLVANFRYNSELGALEPAHNGDGRKTRTTFMVLKEGRLVFEDDQDKIEASKDPYISKFVKQRV